MKEYDVCTRYNSFQVSVLSIKECYFPSINAYEYEHKSVYPSSVILPTSCNGQECYQDVLVPYFVFIPPSFYLSPSLRLFRPPDLQVNLDEFLLGFLCLDTLQCSLHRQRAVIRQLIILRGFLLFHMHLITTHMKSWNSHFVAGLGLSFFLQHHFFW